MQIQAKVVADKHIFFLYAVLNACGYDRENAASMHSVRIKTRRWISERKPDVTELGKMVEAQRHNHWYLLMHELLGDESMERVPGFEELLDKFVQEADLEELWNEVSEEYKTAVSQEQVDEAARKVEEYLRMVDLGVDELVVIPNLLDAYNSGIGPKIGRTAYAILGPSETGNWLGRIQHELLHSIINPLTENEKPMTRSRLREYLIRVMVLRLNVDNSEYYADRREKQIVRGYHRLDYVLTWLEHYEQGDMAFDTYLRSAVDELRLD